MSAFLGFEKRGLASVRIYRLIANASALLLALGCRSAAAPITLTEGSIPVSSQQPDPRLYRILTNIDAKGQRLMVVSRGAGRVRGDGLRLHGDTASLFTKATRHSVSVAEIDSLWVRGSAASLIGSLAAVPCAIFLGAAGDFATNGPDSGGGGHGPGGLLLGAVIGGSVCGLSGALVGSFIPRWHLRYAR